MGSKNIFLNLCGYSSYACMAPKMNGTEELFSPILITCGWKHLNPKVSKLEITPLYELKCIFFVV